MSKEILVNRMGKQTTVFYYNFLQAAYQSKAFGNTKVFPKYLRCTNKTLTQSSALCVNRQEQSPPLWTKENTQHMI